MKKDNKIIGRYINIDFKLVYEISVLIILYKLMLHIVYVAIVYPVYSYQYFDLAYSCDYSFCRDLISWFAIVPMIFSICENIKENKISSQVWILLINLAYIPACVFFVYNNVPYFDIYCLYFLTFGLSIKYIPQIRIKKQIKPKQSKKIIDYLGILMSVNVIYIWAQYSHFHLQLSFLDVYGTRAQAATYELSTFAIYAFGMTKTIIPILTLYYLYNKKYIFSFFYVIIQLICFCIDGTKTTVVLLMLAIAGYWYWGKTRDILKSILLFLSIGVIASLLEYRLLGKSIIVNLFYRRTLFLPNLINSFYFDFFSKNSPDYFRQSIGLLGNSTYGGNISKLIGETYMAKGTNANNGLFSDAYSNLGVGGVVIMPAMLTSVLKIFDEVTKKVPRRIYIAISMSITMLYISSSFFTNMLSHGIALTIVVIYLVNCANVNSGKS